MHRPSRRHLSIAAVAVALVTVPVGPGAAQEVDAVVPAPAIVPFEDWAPASCPRPTGADADTTERVVVHHSHHPTAATPEEVLPALAEMCTIHLARGFDTIGYHYVVDPWGVVYQARGRMPEASGRAPTAQPEGAHVHGANPGATGVVFLGDHEATPPTDAAVDAAVGLLAWLVEATGRDPGELVTIESSGGGTSLHAGQVEVPALAGHNATNATLCPGQHLIALLDPIRDRVRAAIEGGGAGTLAVTDPVAPAPALSAGGVANLATDRPIVAAPPVEPPHDERVAVLGLTPTAAMLAAALLLVGGGRPTSLRLSRRARS